MREVILFGWQIVSFMHFWGEPDPKGYMIVTVVQLPLAEAENYVWEICVWDKQRI